MSPSKLEQLMTGGAHLSSRARNPGSDAKERGEQLKGYQSGSL
jgi:hypothetical protein